MIGNYLHPPTWLHRVPAGVKLATLLGAASVFMILARGEMIAGALALAMLAYASLGFRALAQLRKFFPLLPLLAFIYLAQWYVAGHEVALVSIGRLLLMILLADIVTMTTTMQSMLDVLDPVFRPFARFGLNSRKISLAVALVIRFLPVLFELWSRRAEAWRARSARRTPLRLVGLFVSDALRLADHVAEALDARRFGAGWQAKKK